MIGELRLALAVEVQPGKQHRSNHAALSLWSLLARLGRERRPVLLRGDILGLPIEARRLGREPQDRASEAHMSRAEQEGVNYRFKLRATPNVKRLVERTMADHGRVPAGQGWEGKEAALRLVGWSRARRVVLLRRRLAREVAVAARDDGQLRLAFLEVAPQGERQLYEVAVLVTSLDAEILTLAQLYRDRADCENAFDELKNHGAGAASPPRDLKRCRLIAGIVALVDNWWSLFVRLADPQSSPRGHPSRPLLRHAVAKPSRHGGQTRITVSSMHARAAAAAGALRAIAAFFAGLKRPAEQLSALERWCRILSRALIKYLKGRIRKPPGGLLPASA